MVRQQTLAEMLKERFPEDHVNVVGRGVAGGDVIQMVYDAGRTACGSILGRRSGLRNGTRPGLGSSRLIRLQAITLWE